MTVIVIDLASIDLLVRGFALGSLAVFAEFSLIAAAALFLEKKKEKEKRR